jgi:hypothetical protein
LYKLFSTTISDGVPYYNCSTVFKEQLFVAKELQAGIQGILAKREGLIKLGPLQEHVYYCSAVEILFNYFKQNRPM